MVACVQTVRTHRGTRTDSRKLKNSNVDYLKLVGYENYRNLAPGILRVQRLYSEQTEAFEEKNYSEKQCHLHVHILI